VRTLQGWSVLISLFFLTSFVAAQSQSQLSLMPMPSTVQPGTGQLLIDRSFSVAVTGFHDASLDGGIRRFVAQLSRQTGIPFPPPKPGTTATLQVHADHGREQVQKLGEDESYELTITEARATLTAPTPLGVLHGLETFLQLVQPSANGFAVPAAIIKDQPRFPWRGLLIDVSRHFIPIDVLKRNVDGMAAVKMNVLHWHLSDDQGFRVESKVFPKLHEMGSEGLYYTQSEIRDFIAYAYDRGIRVIPEFDTPGHSDSWFVGYPELASNPGPFSFDPGGPGSVTDPTRESTYKFLDKFVGEMTKLFPDAYFHIGGDEVNGKFWDSNPKIQDFKQAHGMKTNQDLQAYYNQHLEKILTKHHKTMVGWDEILHPDLPKTIIVQSWRGQASLATAAKQGYSGLLSFGYYLDLMWPAARHYAVDPMSGDAANLTPEEKNRILGGEACQWAEWVTPENIDSHIWPRNAAIAERLWSPQQVTDVDSMYTRLNAVSLHLEWLGLTHRSARTHMLHRMAGAEDISALHVLADVVEPVKDYNRWDDAKGPIDFHAPLNQMIDVVYPESDTARQFTSLVQRFIQSGYKDHDGEAQIRVWLTLWRDNHAKLQPLIVQSFLLQEVAPISMYLSGLGDAGLLALDGIDKGEPTTEKWRTAQHVISTAAHGPSAGLLLMVAAPIQQLVDASANPKPSN
jgi:hexosaminidase